MVLVATLRLAVKLEEVLAVLLLVTATLGVTVQLLMVEEEQV